MSYTRVDEDENDGNDLMCVSKCMLSKLYNRHTCDKVKLRLMLSFTHTKTLNKFSKFHVQVIHHFESSSDISYECFLFSLSLS